MYVKYQHLSQNVFTFLASLQTSVMHPFFKTWRRQTLILTTCLTTLSCQCSSLITLYNKWEFFSIVASQYDVVVRSCTAFVHPAMVDITVVSKILVLYFRVQSCYFETDLKTIYFSNCLIFRVAFLNQKFLDFFMSSSDGPIDWWHIFCWLTWILLIMFLLEIILMHIKKSNISLTCSAAFLCQLNKLWRHIFILLCQAYILFNCLRQNTRSHLNSI